MELAEDIREQTLRPVQKIRFVLLLMEWCVCRNPYYAYGNIVVIRHANGLETLYSHNFKNLVKAGDVVKAGQAIGLTGRTGRATTEHVHFETRINGQHFNPNLIFDLKERTLRKECIKCTKNGNKIVVKTQIPDNRIAQNKK